jgi:hypothetical protein
MYTKCTAEQNGGLVSTVHTCSTWSAQKTTFRFSDNLLSDTTNHMFTSWQIASKLCTAWLKMTFNKSSKQMESPQCFKEISFRFVTVK